MTYEDKLERIENLRWQIKKIAPVIDEAKAKLSEESSFAEKFTAMANSEVLNNRRNELAELEKEVKEIQALKAKVYCWSDYGSGGVIIADSLEDALETLRSNLQKEGYGPNFVVYPAEQDDNASLFDKTGILINY